MNAADKTDGRVAMQCPVCGFIALDLPERFVNEYRCLKCQQEVLFCRPRRRKARAAAPRSASRRRERDAVEHAATAVEGMRGRGRLPAVAGALAVCVVLVFAFLAYGRVARREARAALLAQQAREAKAEVARRRKLEVRYRRRLEQALRQPDLPDRRRALLSLRDALDALGEELPVSRRVDRELVRVLVQERARDHERLQAFRRREQELTDLARRLDERAADLETRARVLEARAGQLRIRQDQREQQLVFREAEARKVLEDKDRARRLLARANEQAAEAAARMKRLEELEKKWRDREARLARRAAGLRQREQKLTDAMVELAKRRSPQVVIRDRRPRSSVSVYRNYVYPYPYIPYTSYSSVVYPWSGISCRYDSGSGSVSCNLPSYTNGRYTVIPRGGVLMLR